MSGEEPLRAIIVDDEPLARRGLALRLGGMDGVEVAAECANGREALARIEELEPDILFLDIQMPGMDGFQVIQHLRRGGHMPVVVFVTAYDEYAIQAFETHALDYVLKPVDESRLHQAIYRVRRSLEQKEAVEQRRRLLELVSDLTGKDRDEVESMMSEAQGPGFARELVIRDGRRTAKVSVSDIAWIEAAGDYMCVHAQGETHIMRSTMKALEEQLPPGLFQRIHRSTIVNVERVKELVAHMNGEYFLVLDSGDRLKLSRNYRDRIRHFVRER